MTVEAIRLYPERDIRQFFGDEIVDAMLEYADPYETAYVMGSAAFALYYDLPDFWSDIDIFILGTYIEADYSTAIRLSEYFHIVYTQKKELEDVLSTFPLSITQWALKIGTWHLYATQEAQSLSTITINIDSFFSLDHAMRHTSKWIRRLWKVKEHVTGSPD